jgi:cephalosporin-C deacetylase-like acetyl esterase
VFTSTGNLDYMALDAFSWAPGNTLSVSNMTLSTKNEVYPNPSSEFISVSELNTSKNYKIYNVLGHEISQGSINKNEKINIQNFANGLYFIHFEDGIIKKFMKK